MRKENHYNPIFLIIGIFIVFVVILYIFIPIDVIENTTVNSNFFIALTTFLVGAVAIYLYIKQKNDHKRDAANIILMEIRHAESVIDQIRTTRNIDVDSIQALLPTNNWVKYNYLFIKNLDRDELDDINNFYNRCALIDRSLPQVSIASQLEQKAGHIHNAIVQLAMEESKLSNNDDQNIIRSFNVKKEKFVKIIHNDSYVFPAAAPRDNITSTLANIDKITTSSSGNKLKIIAKID